MKVLVIGGGGREHTLVWKLAQDSRRPEIFCAPGNAGTAALGSNLPIGAEDIGGLLEWARDEKPDLTVVGPEAPLCAGIVDSFEASGLRIFGPKASAANMEGSKAFAKAIMQSAGVPTAWAQTFTDADEAKAFVHEKGAPIVVKADGLAAGKGVTVCKSIDEAEQAINESLVDRAFGDSGSEVLIEECLVGEEASILGLVDGEHIVLLASSQDHKPAYDGDAGPNTGGMGAYSPAPIVGEDMWPFIRSNIFEATVSELKKRGIEFKGVLYAGLMMTADGPKVLEFNVRFGDPECEAILPRWEGDIIPVLEACIDGTLTDDLIRWKDDPCVCVVMASGGYPGAYEKGKLIKGLDKAGAIDHVTVFHAGTKTEEDSVVTSGGRVLGVTATGSDLAQAIDTAYKAVSIIQFDGAHYRKDIGAKALKVLS
ncbi:MAG: phosphoribosylamine--glycine ligase [Verrucomicrobia bacterium]|nr:phosphoribosylamine--glycine ligase [Verrucomicrobiota bacterium]